ncbi:MAG: Crp/Fnr family transcriptional regulator [Methylophilaceae bacterium]|nr:Crp/Fnr family transcriptional regulator [Methylophilaceae bacterium]
MNTLLKALPNTSLNASSGLSLHLPRETLGTRQNHLLASLPYSELSLWEHELELVDLKLGQILCEPGIKHTHVIFPTTAIVSLLYMTQEGTSSEIAVVGNDGVVGVSVFMGGNETPNQAMVQSAGQGYRLRTQAAKNAVNRDGPLLQMLLRYTQAMITQISQTAVCNRHHSIDQQLCRRLLVGLDRLPADDLVMTQELLASLLGVRRESVTTAALKLQEAGVIHYSRGHITVLNRKSLEYRCCECYAMVKKEQNRLMPAVHQYLPSSYRSASAMEYSL